MVEMGRTCSTHRTIQKFVHNVSVKTGGKETFREAEA